MSADTSALQQHDDAEGLTESGQIVGQDDPTQLHTPSSNDAAELPNEVNAHTSSLQKRRRVTRACDECRKKKIRCDGKQPCTHCTVYSYECSYDQPSNRRRNPAPLFLEAMEKKLKRAESLLQLTFPGVNLEDPRFDVLLQGGSIAEAGLRPSNLQDGAAQTSATRDSNVHDHDADLESMITSKGELNQDEKGEYAYYGASSGMNFLRRMSEEFGMMAKTKPSHQRRQASEPPPKRMSNVIMEIPGQHGKVEPSSEHDISIDDLPQRETARRLVHYALNDACAIIPCVHQPSFYRAFDRIYDLAPDQYTNQDHRFLPLLYVVVAVGCLFAEDEQSELERSGYLSATDEGYRYFWAARQLMDVTDCRDLVSLQALIFIILFLQCSAKLATCYSFIGVAMRSALRMGMHRSFQDSFNPIESELRKRCFWIIRKMDVMVGAMLGLPLSLSDYDIDQDFPTEVNDDYISADGIRPQPKDTVSILTAVNHDFRLTNIVCKIVRYIYPIKGLRSDEQEPSRVYRVRLSVIKEIEKELQAWEENLQPMFKPGYDASPQLVRIQNLLRMGFAYVQMMLYRPFLHYVSSRSHPNQAQPSARACSAACVQVSRNIICITASMNHSGLLVGSYWFTMYSCFFAVLSLVFYALENADVNQDTKYHADIGRHTLAALAKRSMAADRCTATLRVLFDQIESKATELHHSSSHNSTARKREEFQTTEFASASNLAHKNLASSGRKASKPVQRSSIARADRVQPQIAPQNQRQGATCPDADQQSPLSRSQVHQEAGFPMHTPIPQQVQQSQAMGQMLPVTASISPGFPLPEVEHFSRMMFPSSDPFAYPNQPMLALDRSGTLTEHQRHIVGQPDGFVSASTARTENGHADDFMDVNMLGIPNYPTTDSDAGQANARFVPDVHMSGQPDLPSHPVPESTNNPFPGFSFGEFFGSGDWQQRM